MSNQAEEMTEDQKFESDLLDKVTNAEEIIAKTKEIIVALCDHDSRCTVCYRYISFTNKSDCGGCDEYYCECQCTPLTPMQIINGETE